MRTWPVTAALLAIAAPADAHQVVSPTMNNRYVKVAPGADRVRLAYTIVFGNTPGHAARQALDVDADGQVSDAEVAPWKAKLAETVRGQLEVWLDGVRVPVAWSEVEVGLGTPDVAGGSLSLDLIAWLCAPKPGARHELDVIDRFVLAPPGETEVKVDPEPGVTVDVERVGPEGGGGALIDHLRKFEGSAAPMSEGLHVVYTATGAPLADGRCPAPAAPSKSRPKWPLVVGAIAALAVTIALTVRRARLRS